MRNIITWLVLAALLFTLPCCALAEESWDDRISHIEETLGINPDIDSYDPSYITPLGFAHIIPMTSGIDAEGNQNILYFGFDTYQLSRYIAYLELFDYTYSGITSLAGDEEINVHTLSQPDQLADDHLVPPVIELYHFVEQNALVIHYPVGYETLDRVLRTRLINANLPNESPVVCDGVRLVDNCALIQPNGFAVPVAYPDWWIEDDLFITPAEDQRITGISTSEYMELMLLTLRLKPETQVSWDDLTLCTLDWYNTEKDVADGGRCVALPIASVSDMYEQDFQLILDNSEAGDPSVRHFVVPLFHDSDDSYYLFVGTGEGTLLEWPHFRLDVPAMAE